MRLAESVSEILRFITEARDASVTCAVEDGQVVFFLEGGRRADECVSAGPLQWNWLSGSRQTDVTSFLPVVDIIISCRLAAFAECRSHVR